MSRFAAIPLLAAVAVFALTAGARADAIDGNWCSPDSRHLSIDGPNITTPAGSMITGDYDRHAFAYVIPDSEPDAGASVRMRMVDENTINLVVGSDAAAPVETWRRCELTT